jgi:chromosome segregation ATPase
LSLHPLKSQLVIGAFLFVLFAAVLFIPQTQAQTSIDQPNTSTAEFLLKNFQAANGSLAQTIQTQNNLLPQTATVAFRDAQILFAQATREYEQANYQAATGLAMQALSKLKETLSALNDLPDEVNPQQISLQTSLSRCLNLRVSLEKMAASASSRGLDTSKVDSKLSSAKMALETAQTSLNQANLHEAEVQIRRAKVQLDEVNGYFDSLAASLKIDKLNAFIAASEQKLVSLEEQVNSVSGELSSADRAAACAALTQAQNSLTLAKQSLTGSDVSMTITALASMQASQAEITTITSTVTAVSPTATPTPIATARTNSSVNSADAAKATKP